MTKGAPETPLGRFIAAGKARGPVLAQTREQALEQVRRLSEKHGSLVGGLVLFSALCQRDRGRRGVVKLPSFSGNGVDGRVVKKDDRRVFD
jgi:hypothetical protein